jgi:hypothetical protein
MRNPDQARMSRETGSLPIAMLFTLVGIGLSGLLLTSLLTQLNLTRTDVARVRALNAAQAGLDVGIGHIRVAVDAAGVGLLSSLPCDPFPGTVGAAGSAAYTVKATYFSVSPDGQSATWLNDNALQCVPGGGTKTTPVYAWLVSTGTFRPSASGPATNRTLTATYNFRSSDTNIPGGLIRVNTSGTTVDLCMDAGTSSPAAGTLLQMQPCSPGLAQQTFAYNPDLTLLLVASRTSTLPLGMCLDAGTPHTVGLLVQFRPCSVPTPFQQKWSFNDSAYFVGTSDGTTLDGYCFNVVNVNTPGSTVNLVNSCKSTFQPEASVGAGAAAATSGQLVNLKQFGRCLDVTNQQVDYGYLIIWPCKQAPNPTNVTWNQRFTMPVDSPDPDLGIVGVGPITTQPPAGKYCLQSPLSATAGYIQTIVCPTTITPAMTWTVYGNTGAYISSYRIVDSIGNCMTPSASTDMFATTISKVVTRPCGSSTTQKWNAPAGILESQPLKNITES